MFLLTFADYDCFVSRPFRSSCDSTWTLGPGAALWPEQLRRWLCTHPTDPTLTATSNVRKGQKMAKGSLCKFTQISSAIELNLVGWTVDQCYLSNLHCTSSQCQTTARTENLNIAEASCKGYKIVQDLLISECLVLSPTGQAWLKIIMSHKHDCSQKLLAAQTSWAWSLSSDIHHHMPLCCPALNSIQSWIDGAQLGTSTSKMSGRYWGGDISENSDLKMGELVCVSWFLLPANSRTIRVKTCQKLSGQYRVGSLNLADWPRHTCCNMVKLGPTRHTYRNNWRSTNTVFTCDLEEIYTI